METTIYMEHIESYCYCPYCETLISDKINVDEVSPDLIINCPECKKDFKVLREP